jgi:hypothetical protein
MDLCKNPVSVAKFLVNHPLFGHLPPLVSSLPPPLPEPPPLATSSMLDQASAHMLLFIYFSWTGNNNNNNDDDDGLDTHGRLPLPAPTSAPWEWGK